jgi:hypothetical protein
LFTYSRIPFCPCPISFIYHQHYTILATDSSVEVNKRNPYSEAWGFIAVATEAIILTTDVNISTLETTL